MALTLEEKALIRDFGGYLSTQPVASIQLGFPRASQAQFLVEVAMDRIIAEAETAVVRKFLVECQRIDAEIGAARSRLKARRLGELELNPDNELRALKKELVWWIKRLYDALGAPVNIYSERFAGTGISVRVDHGM